MNNKDHLVGQLTNPDYDYDEDDDAGGLSWLYVNDQDHIDNGFVTDDNDDGGGDGGWVCGGEDEDCGDGKKRRQLTIRWQVSRLSLPTATPLHPALQLLSFLHGM